MKLSVRHASGGFSLIEVMISLVVVSLGLGGIMLSQARAISSTHSGGYSMQANLLAQQILDRARANPGQSYATTDAPPSPAATDLAEWQALISTTLPGGWGTIAKSAVGSATQKYEQLTIRIGWNDRRGATNGIAVATDGTSASGVLLQGYRVLP